MDKFSIVSEKLENKKYFKIVSEVDMIVESDSEGEASYISDSTLSSIKNQAGYSIKNISEITKNEFDDFLVVEKKVINK